MAKKIGKVNLKSLRRISGEESDYMNEYDYMYDKERNIHYHGKIAKADLSDGADTQEEIEGWIYDINYDGEDGIDLKKTETSDIIIRYNDIYDHNYQTGLTIQSGSDHVYVYGNSISDAENGILMTDGSTGYIWVFSNLIYNIEEKAISAVDRSDAYGTAMIGTVDIFNNVISKGGACVDREGTAECRTGGSTQWGNFYHGSSSTVTFKNNILYNSRETEGSPYMQAYILSTEDEDTTSDYNYYYWYDTEQRASTFYWGSDGSNTIAQLATLGAPFGNQEVNGADANPGLTDIDNNDFTIATGAAVIGAGSDMGTGAIATVTIQGVAYPVYWDIALATGTSFPGDGTIPTIVTTTRDSYDAWDIGAYQSTGPSISSPTPTSQQLCVDDPQNVSMGVTSSANATCRYSAKGADTCATAYASLDTEFADTTDQTTHITDISQACAGATEYVVICNDDSTSLDSNCLEITVDVAAAGGVPPQPAPGIIAQMGASGNLTIVGGGNVSVGGGYIEMLGSKFR